MNTAVLRDDMVDSLEHPSKGVVRSDEIGLAMRSVPREQFVDDESAAYADRSHRVLGTTVFAPSTVARLLESLDPEPSANTLVVGAGVGYSVAVLAEVVGARNVQAIELSRPVVRQARTNLARAGYDSVLVEHGDGASGLPAYAPYDRILLETGIVEPPRTLLDQLDPEGRLVLPQGPGVQELVAIEDEAVVAEHGTIAVEPMLVAGEEAGAIERNRTAREDREIADRAAQRRRGWEREWIDWDRS